RVVIEFDVLLERDDQSDDFFPVHFLPAPDVRVGRGVQQGGLDEILTAREDAARRGATEVLPPAEVDQVSAERRVARQARQRRQFAGRVDEDGDARLL